MLSPDVIQSIFVSNPGLDGPNSYHGHYNSLLLSAFPTVQFTLSWDCLNHIDAITLHLRTTRTTRKPVFILLITPNNTSVTRENAEATMLRLLEKSDGLNVMHGVCVCGTQAAFYQYDRERQIVLPKPQGQVDFDFDLAMASGAVRFVEVTEDVMQMSRELICLSLERLEGPLRDKCGCPCLVIASPPQLLLQASARPSNSFTLKPLYLQKYEAYENINVPYKVVLSNFGYTLKSAFPANAEHDSYTARGCNMFEQLYKRCIHSRCRLRLIFTSYAPVAKVEQTRSEVHMHSLCFCQVNSTYAIGASQ